MTTMLELEQQDIELQLQEIQLKRRALEIEREKLVEKVEPVIGPPVLARARCVIDPIVRDEHLHLHYSKSAKESVMTIVGVTHEGCILVQNGNNSGAISRKYNVRSMKWLRDNLSRWSKKQKVQSHFWTNIAAKYSRKFLEGDSISRTTVEKLCYLVDSGRMEKWFDEYDHLRSNCAQSQLDI